MAPPGSHTTTTGVFLFLALFICAVLLLSISINTRYLITVENALRLAATPIVYVSQLPRTISSSIGFYLTSIDDLQAHNNQLLQDLSRLNATIAELEHAKLTIQDLESILAYETKLSHSHLLAEIIYVNPNRQRQEVVINAGENDGIEIGTCILDQWGVYGKAIEVFPDSSRVLLLNDERHAVPVLVKRTQQYFIASGNGPGQPLTLDNVNLSANIQIGDELITSGLGGLFPSGLVVGVVQSVNDLVSESAKQVEVEPSARLETKSYLRAILRDTAS